MALGPQFEDTYHYDDNDNLHIHLNLQDKYEHLVYTPEQQKVHEIKNKEHILDTVSKSTGKVLQGTIFSPHSFTGTKDDPAYTAEERTAAIQKGLRLTSPEEYAKFTKYQSWQYKRVGSRTPVQAKSDIKLLTETAFNSGIPTHMFSQFDNPVIMNFKPKGVLGEAYNRDPGNHPAFVSMAAETRKQLVVNRIPTNNKYIVNPNYGDHYLKELAKVKESDDPHGGPQVYKKYRIHPGYITLNGENYKHDKWRSVNNPEDHLTPEARGKFTDEIEKGHDVDIKHMSGLPGYLWPGKGKDTDEYTVHPVRVKTAETETYNYRTESDRTYTKTALFHVRIRRPGPDEPTNEIRRRDNTGVGFRAGTDGINTLTHELGHIRDYQGRLLRNLAHNGLDTRKNDTVTEAIADGHSDRFGKNYATRFESDLLPSADREKVMDTTGYSTQHSIAGGQDFEDLDEATGKYVPRKKTPEQRLRRAVYAAVRLHVSLGDDNHRGIPGGEILKKHKENTGYTTNGTYLKLVLGHLYTNHQHVRGMLSQMGLDDVGKESSDYYRSTITDAGRPHPDDEPQLKTLFD